MASNYSERTVYDDTEAQPENDDTEAQPENVPPKRIKPPDGGWGWMVVLGSFMNHVVIDGTAFSIGVIYVQMIDYFDAPTADVAWIGALQYAMVNLAGPVAEAMIKVFSSRSVGIVGTVIAFAGFVLSYFTTQLWQLYITFGVITGFGFGLKFLPSIVCVHEYFDKRQTLAMSLAVCGTGIGTFGFAPLSQILMDEYGWKGALLIEGAIVLNGVAFCGLFRPLEESVKKSVDTSMKGKIKSALTATKNIFVEMIDFSLFKNATFSVYCVCMFLFAVGYVVPITYLPERAVEIGIEDKSAAWLISMMGIANTLGRILIGFVGDKLKNKRIFVFGTCILLSGVSTGCISLLTNYLLMSCYAVFYGLMIGTFICLESVVLRDLVGIEFLNKGYGLAIFVGYGFGTLVATPFTGWIYDITRDYKWSFSVAMILLASSALSLTLIPCIRKCQTTEQNTDTEMADIPDQQHPLKSTEPDA